MIDWQHLTPDERNRLVAVHIFGWKPESCPGNHGTLYWSDHGIQWQCGLCGAGATVFTEFEHVPPNMYPDYTNDMNAAWLVVEKMKETDTDPGREGSHTNFTNFATLVDEIEEIALSCSNFYLLWSITPEVICIAALRASGLEVQH